jgi:hypothetical protein
VVFEVNLGSRAGKAMCWSTLPKVGACGQLSPVKNWHFVTRSRTSPSESLRAPQDGGSLRAPNEVSNDRPSRTLGRLWSADRSS